jgi:hypothetical protein
VTLRQLLRDYPGSFDGGPPSSEVLREIARWWQWVGDLR